MCGMEKFIISSEQDIKQWVKEAVTECFSEFGVVPIPKNDLDDNLLSRKDIAMRLGVSLGTLNSWMKKGLPFHKPKRKVYFVLTEVIEYIKMNKMGTDGVKSNSPINGHISEV
jgi:hypothetical protein